MSDIDSEVPCWSCGKRGEKTEHCVSCDKNISECNCTQSRQTLWEHMKCPVCGATWQGVSMYINEDLNPVQIHPEAWGKLSSVIESLQTFIYYDGEWEDVLDTVSTWNEYWVENDV